MMATLAQGGLTRQHPGRFRFWSFLVDSKFLMPEVPNTTPPHNNTMVAHACQHLPLCKSSLSPHKLLECTDNGRRS